MRERRLGLVILATVVFAGVLSAQRDYALAKPQKQWRPGQQPPDFILRDQDGSDLRLADLRGRRVVLIFYRGYW